PGAWMKHVKYGFGVLILLFAAYYGHLAWNLSGTPLGVAARSTIEPAFETSRFTDALNRARAEGRPVLIDFAASWCKNCLAMDETVFPSPEVQARLKHFVFIRYDAEKPNEAPARDILDRFGVMGLPTYVLLSPQEPKTP
ncbi:MAG: thioredoxin family protein, partial [Limisphaerales bacterium]